MQKSELYSARVCLRIVCLILFGLVIRQLPDFRTASIAVFGLFISWTLLVARQGKGGQKAIRLQKVRACGVDILSGMGTADMHMGRLVTASATTGKVVEALEVSPEPQPFFCSILPTPRTTC
jgi:hypothetical protein